MMYIRASGLRLDMREFGMLERKALIADEIHASVVCELGWKAQFIISRYLDHGMVAEAYRVKAVDKHLHELLYSKANFNPAQPRVPAGSPNGGQWTNGGSDNTLRGGAEDDLPGIGKTPQSTRHSTAGGVNYNNKIRNDMAKRNWQPVEIDDAVKNGYRIDATNKANGNAATRYVNPTTGKSVIIDNVTNDIVQVGGEDFGFGVESGDVPGAQMKPPPVSRSGSGTGVGGFGKPQDIFHPGHKPWDRND